MEHKVYFLKDNDDNIVYVGMTSRTLKQRLGEHINLKPLYRNGHGKFYGRDDISIELFDIYKTKEDAAHVEGVLKEHLGFEWTEKTKSIKGGKASGLIQGKLKKESGKWDDLRKMGNQKMKELYSETILVYTTSGQFVGEYPSQKDAANKLEIILGCNVEQGGISAVIRGKCKTYKGHIFKRKL